MKIRLGELKRLIKETALTEISDPDKAHQHLIDLVQQAIDNPKTGEHPLLGFMRTLGASKDDVTQMRTLVKDDPDNAINRAHELAFKLLDAAKSRIIKRQRV